MKQKSIITAISVLSALMAKDYIFMRSGLQYSFLTSLLVYAAVYIPVSLLLRYIMGKAGADKK